MDYESIKADVLKELELLGLPQSEIDRIILDFDDVVTKVSDNPSLMKRLATDLISAAKFRANLKSEVPDTIPDDMIIEDIAQQETANKTFEVSTKGDDFGKQFSALNATFKEGPYKGRTIEDVWQNEIKKSGKGKPPAQNSILFGKDYQVSKDEYQKLWQMWADENPELISKLKNKVNEGYSLVDSFAGDPNKTVNQAEALTNILNNQGGTPTSFETVKRYSVEDLRNNPNKIYIFGDNTEGWGKGGQAIVRDEPNAFGISTKDSPTQFMSDDNFEANKAKIDADIAAIKTDGRPIVFPEDGIGTGRADLQNKAPRTWAYLQKELNKLKGELKGGGSLGAAKLNDPNIFPEKIEEYDPDIHKSFKESILDKMTDSELKVLDYINNHPTMQTAKLNGESLLLGLVKTFGVDVFDKYNSLSKFNPVKVSGKLSKSLYRIFISVLDPIGEGVETAVRIGVKTGIVKDAIQGRHAMGDSFLRSANQGRKAAKGAKATGAVTGRLGGIASNLRYELYNQLAWQGTAAMVATTLNASDALNSVLDKYGLLPKFVKENIDVIPYEDLNKHLAHQSRYWQSAGWQGSKLTSVWHVLDTMLPAITTGNTPHNWGVNKAVMSQFPQRFELDADEKDYWDIISGQREFKIKNQDGFFGWWKNEIEQTGQFGVNPSYFAQVNNPDLNIYNANSHVDTWKKLQKIKDRFGPGIMEMAGYDIQMYNDVENEVQQ